MSKLVQGLLLSVLGLGGCVRPFSTPPPPVSTLPPGGSTLIATTAVSATLDLSQGEPHNRHTETPPQTSTRLPPTPLPSPIPSSTTTQTPNIRQEAPVELIPLAGPINQPDAEISGMAWFSDTLVLLPQYPNRYGDQGVGSLFTIPKAELVAFLDGGSTQPITPTQVPIYTPGIHAEIPGFEGFEAIAFAGERVYLTVEANPGKMVSYLVSGWYDPGLKAVYIEPDRRATILPQSDLPNLGEESLVPFGRRLVTIYEANGIGVNPDPKAHMFGQDLTPMTELAFPHLEYRITDATPADDSGRFWVINIFSPADVSLQPRLDPLAEHFGRGRSHSTSSSVERLIELQFTEQGIVLSETPPIQLELDPKNSRDWAAIARLDERGFLLATDRNPATLLAFIPARP